MPFIEQLIQSLDARIRELNGEIASLQDARTALTSNGRAALRARAPRRDVRPERMVRRKPARTSRVLRADQAERLLASTNGLTTTALARQADADRDQVLALLRDLEKAGHVRRTGQRRGTHWQAITDEDRIRERAAELAGRSRRRSK